MNENSGKPTILFLNKNFKRFSLPHPEKLPEFRCRYFVKGVDDETREWLDRKKIDYKIVGRFSCVLDILSSKWNVAVTGFDFFMINKAAYPIAKLLGRKTALLYDAWKWSERRTGPKLSLFLALSNIFTSWADIIIVPGKKSAAYLEGKGVGAEKIRLCRPAYAFDLAEGKGIGAGEKLRRELGIADKVVFLYFGRIISERKNVKLLIDAFNDVSKENTEAALLIGGYGKDKEALERHCAGEGIENVFFLSGFHDTDTGLAAYYDAADCFVFPAKWEPSGCVVYEAFAFGKPLIATDDCGNSIELIENGENGFIVKHDNREELAKAMTAFASDKKLRLRMTGKAGEKARLIARGRPTQEDAIRELALGRTR